MLLDCVISAVNENPLYYDFIPLFIKTWNKLYPNVDIKVILIAEEIPNNIKNYIDNIILFKPIANISTGFISQYIRLLYPCILNYKNGVLITDIDMIPMNRTYYTDNISSYDNNKFIYYREKVCFEYKQIAMCYNVASPKVWSEIFQINNLNDIINRLTEVYSSIEHVDGHGKAGWSTDQLHLYNYIINWNNKTNNFVYLKENDTKFNRLCRGMHFDINNPIIRSNISNGVYTDYHCYRPMAKYFKENNIIYDLL